MKLTTNDELQLGDGSHATPSISFTSNTTTGFYRTSANAIGISVGGATSAVFSTNFTPSYTSDTSGVVNQISFDANYLYIKTTAGWKRAALSTWSPSPPPP